MLASVAAGSVNGAVLLTRAGVSHITLLAAAEEALGNRNCFIPLLLSLRWSWGPPIHVHWSQEFLHPSNSPNLLCIIVMDLVVTFLHRD